MVTIKYFIGVLMLLTSSSVYAIPIETDTLFSWQSLPEIMKWASVGPKSQLFLDNYLYAWRTPTATFAYGDAPIRIKLRPGLDFFELSPDQRDCRKLPANQKEHTVYYSNLGGGTIDYILCSHKVISSWSFGTKESLAEIKNEYELARAHPELGDYYTGFYSASRRCPDCIFGTIMDQDVSEWRESALQKKITFLEALANSDLPRIFCMGKEIDCAKSHFEMLKQRIYGPVPLTSHLSSEPLLLLNRNFDLYINPSYIQNDSYKFSTHQILKTLTSVKVYTSEPTKKGSLCIGFQSVNCGVDFAIRTKADEIRFDSSEDPSMDLLFYISRFRHFLTFSRFNESLLKDFATLAAQTPVNTLILKEETYVRYISETNTCTRQFVLDPVHVAQQPVSLLDCKLHD